MTENDTLAEAFEANRKHLRGVAYRMLGSRAEADDAVQEAWLRLARADVSAVDNLGGWLTTVVARVCLDMLRSRSSKGEESLDVPAHEATTTGAADADVENELILADSVGLALLVVLETLTPAERVAFVLHDMFDLSFDEIAPIVGRTPVAARQLASRARRRVQGSREEGSPDRDRQRRIVDAFLAASRGGDFAALLEVLDPDVVYRAPPGPEGWPSFLRGAQDVATMFRGRARGARPALIGGEAGLVWAPGGKVRVAFKFTTVEDHITAIELIADPATIQELGVEIVDG